MKRILLRVNKVFWILFVVTLMVHAKNQWSQYGDYTWGSFFVSSVVHGGLGLMLYLGCEALIKKFMKD